jgi:HSP20 family protein
MEGNMTKEKDKAAGKENAIKLDVGLGLGGIFKGLSSLVEKLGELAEKGGELSQTGEIRGTDAEKGVKGIYGFSVKMGLGGEGVKVEPFGNIRKDKATGEATVQEIREPLVDVFEEEDHVLIVAEMPGIGENDLQLDLKEDILTLSAERGDKKYRKEVLLPGSFEHEKMTVCCNNGMVEIKCQK